ncbi:hypothetical protein SDC9_156912 [bioreactor metagenome]|uniref:Uncharacterized protein n=1 Tax=bioreactor metagenome TaxID=1076179 RepID=A0A645F5S8_9ZZZZ
MKFEGQIGGTRFGQESFGFFGIVFPFAIGIFPTFYGTGNDTTHHVRCSVKSGID